MTQQLPIPANDPDHEFYAVFGADPGAYTWENTVHGKFTEEILNNLNSTEEVDILFRKVRKALLKSTNGNQRSWTHHCLTSPMFLHLPVGATTE